jgi:hypothetical protein
VRCSWVRAHAGCLLTGEGKLGTWQNGSFVSFIRLIDVVGPCGQQGRLSPWLTSVPNPPQHSRQASRRLRAALKNQLENMQNLRNMAVLVYRVNAIGTVTGNPEVRCGNQHSDRLHPTVIFPNRGRELCTSSHLLSLRWP